MTAIVKIAKDIENLSEDEKEKIMRFRNQGCMNCHTIKEGQVRLTERGEKVRPFVPGGCVKVMEIITQQAEKFVDRVIIARAKEYMSRAFKRPFMYADDLMAILDDNGDGVPYGPGDDPSNDPFILDGTSPNSETIHIPGYKAHG